MKTPRIRIRTAADRYRVEQNEQIRHYKLVQEMERDRRRLELDTVLAQQQADARRLARLAEMKALQKRIEFENTLTPMGLQRDFVEKALPAVAEAMAKSMDYARLYIGQGARGGTPFKFILGERLEMMQYFLSRADGNANRAE